EARTSDEVIPPYPSNKFVLELVQEALGSDLLQRKYNEYSHFVHSYFTSWHIFPFSSVLEFKILKHELSIFADIIREMIDLYLKELFL
ncbi:MAG: hypothetical protein ACTSRV_14110, partial [Candidatus Freyarchaeota archaeon]